MHIGYNPAKSFCNITERKSHLLVVSRPLQTRYRPHPVLWSVSSPSQKSKWLQKNYQNSPCLTEGKHICSVRSHALETPWKNVDSPLNQVEIRTKLASLSEVKAKIDKLRTESYRVLSDEELMDFETSLDTMEVDADNLEVSLNTLLKSSNVDTSELSVKMILLITM
ncbi:hypothetical protein TNCV_1030491 [Trichonephila clavipes]|nr:hypothetical protein TNCV_1030491 [Trichonephila clavipes]